MIVILCIMTIIKYILAHISQSQVVNNILSLNKFTQEDPLKKEMATHSGILAWEIPWTKEAGGLQSVKSQRGGHCSNTCCEPAGRAVIRIFKAVKF